jgi:hypothetical protein
MKDIQIIYLALALGSMGYLWVQNVWNPVVWKLQKKFKYKRFMGEMKPVDCEKCMALWSAVALSIVLGLGWYQAVLLIGISPTVAVLIEITVRKA